MRTSLHPAVVVSILVVVLAGAIYFVYRGSLGVNTGSGKMQSDLKMDDAMKTAQKDPAAFRKAVEESMKKDGVSHGQ